MPENSFLTALNTFVFQGAASNSLEKRGLLFFFFFGPIYGLMDPEADPWIQ